jgi:hypothetical protein
VVMGTEIPMGPSAMVIAGFRIESEAAARLRAALADPQQTGPFQVDLVETETASLTSLYERWLPEGEFDSQLFEQWRSHLEPTSRN